MKKNAASKLSPFKNRGTVTAAGGHLPSECGTPRRSVYLLRARSKWHPRRTECTRTFRLFARLSRAFRHVNEEKGSKILE